MSDRSVDPGLILRNAVGMEIQGRVFYQKAAEKMTSQGAKDMFLKLMEQERVHIDVLEDQLNMFVHDKGWVTLKQLKENASAPRISVFDDKDIKEIKIGPNSSELDVVKLGVKVEEKSIEYYRAAVDDFQDRNAKDIFGWLVEQETMHLQILKAEHDRRAKA